MKNNKEVGEEEEEDTCKIETNTNSRIIRLNSPNQRSNNNIRNIDRKQKEEQK